MESRPYKVIDTENPDAPARLVDAPNSTRAVRHVVADYVARFVATPASGRDVAELMRAGVTMEAIDGDD